ncbi:MAG TPA: hypothetical protein VFA71_15490 [Terriglobales bacterium]|nr:hypothetical protein [Terriglobales bacterium]
MQSAGQVASSSSLACKYHSIVPLGIERVKLVPAGHNVDLIASAESSSFEGLQKVEQSHRLALVSADGTKVQNYPGEISFRLTASRLDKLKDEEPPLEIETKQDVGSFLLGLHLRLKIFRGVDAYELEPDESELIGVPATIPYDERIYRATFHLDHVPTEARIVLEVFDAEGNRITRFHLELL